MEMSHLTSANGGLLSRVKLLFIHSVRQVPSGPADGADERSQNRAGQLEVGRASKGVTERSHQ